MRLGKQNRRQRRRSGRSGRCDVVVFEGRKARVTRRVKDAAAASGLLMTPEDFGVKRGGVRRSIPGLYDVGESGRVLYRVHWSGRHRKARRLLARKTAKFRAAPRRWAFEGRKTEEWSEITEGIEGVEDMSWDELEEMFEAHARDNEFGGGGGRV